MQANIKRQKRQTSANVMFLSANIVLSDCIPVVNQNGNRLYDTFAMKVAFSSLYFVLRVFFINTLPVLKSVDCTWFEEKVIAVQAIL